MIFLNALIISLFILGIHIACEEGMIFGAIRKLKLPEFIAKPLYDCILCMASIWGTFGFFLVTDYTFFNIDRYFWDEWILTIVILIPLNGALWGLFKRVE